MAACPRAVMWRGVSTSSSSATAFRPLPGIAWRARRGRVNSFRSPPGLAQSQSEGAAPSGRSAGTFEGMDRQLNAILFGQLRDHLSVGDAP